MNVEFMFVCVVHALADVPGEEGVGGELLHQDQFRLKIKWGRVVDFATYILIVKTKFKLLFFLNLSLYIDGSRAVSVSKVV